MTQRISPRVAILVCSSLLILNGALAQSLGYLIAAGNLAEGQGHYDEAITTWNAVLAKDPKNGDAYRSRGACYFHKNDFTNAIADLSRAIALNTNDVDAYSWRGESYSKKGNLGNAISDFNRVIQLNPQTFYLYQRIIDLSWDNSDWDNVITNTTKVIQLNLADGAWAHCTRGSAWQFKGDLDRALEDFNSAIQLNPTWDAPLTDRAQVRIKKGDLQGALADLSEAIRLNPANEDNYDARDTIYRKTKDWDADIKNWNEAIQNNPTNVTFLWSRAGTYQRGKKDFDHALADYGRAIDLDPQNKGTYTARAYAYQRQNLPDKAIPDFTKLIEVEPTNSSGYARRAFAYFEAGKYKEARSDYEEFIRQNPTNSFGYLELAFRLATCPDASFRNGKEALALARKGCALETNQDACAYALAVACAEVGDFDEAVRNEKLAISYLRKSIETDGGKVPAKTETRAKEILQLFEQHKPYHGIVKMSDWAN